MAGNTGSWAALDATEGTGTVSVGDDGLGEASGPGKGDEGKRYGEVFAGGLREGGAGEVGTLASLGGPPVDGHAQGPLTAARAEAKESAVTVVTAFGDGLRDSLCAATCQAAGETSDENNKSAKCGLKLSTAGLKEAWPMFAPPLHKA